ncbi:uncharacterized protein METZ01_LOCUS421084, partial [marine metagenome]
MVYIFKITENYSDRKALNNGDRIAAIVAAIDAVRPAATTMDSSTASDNTGMSPPRSINAGAMATRAHPVPT